MAGSSKYCETGKNRVIMQEGVDEPDSRTVSMDMSPVKLDPATPTKRTCVVPLGSLACEAEGEASEASRSP